MTAHSGKRSRVTRVDKAHIEKAPIPEAAGPEQSMLAAVAGKAMVESSMDSESESRPHVGLQQVERHARELGQQLQTQQRTFDQRQAEFNAKLARIETELRAARMQQRERELELSEKETDFQTRWQVLQDQATDVANAEMALNAEVQEGRLHDSYNHEQIRDALQRWKIRLQELDKSELQLQAQLADVENERCGLREERQKLEAERQKSRQQTATERSLIKQRADRQLRDLQRQSERIERKKRSIEQLHADVSRMYREAIELRICTEELWGRISEQRSPALLTVELTALRRKLADQFHLANQSLTDQKSEIEELVTQLESQHSNVHQERDKLQRWLSRRHAELEQQAARLVARERELDKQQSSIQALEHHWDDQRRQFERTIRDLRRQLVLSGGTPMSLSYAE